MDSRNNLVPPAFASETPRAMQGFVFNGDCTPTPDPVRRRTIRQGADALRSPCMIGAMNITWQQLIQDLRDSGMPMRDREALRPQPQAVTDIGSGRTAEPAGFAAVKMYALHARRMPLEKKAA